MTNFRENDHPRTRGGKFAPKEHGEQVEGLDSLSGGGDVNCVRCGRRLTGAESELCGACIKASEHADDSYEEPMCPGCGVIRFSSDVAAGVCRDCGWPNESNDDDSHDEGGFADRDIREHNSFEDVPAKDRIWFFLQDDDTGKVTGPFDDEEDAQAYITWSGITGDGLTVIDGGKNEGDTPDTHGITKDETSVPKVICRSCGGELSVGEREFVHTMDGQCAICCEENYGGAVPNAEADFERAREREI